MHWIMAPVILPAMVAPVIAFLMRNDIGLARITSFVATFAFLAIAVFLVAMAASGETYVYNLGNWPAPFGIVLVVDRLSAAMVLLTAVLATLVLWHAVATDWDAKGRHFHALFQFQLMGIAGAFLTGDAFNLFVFFEVLLIASYGLMIHGGGKIRVQAGLQYVVMNLAGSTLFLFALAVLYASTGTLNIADLSVKVAEIPAEDSALIRVAAVLLLLVFMVKAALFPVQFWLPATYANAPAPVAALFAIMTKVGAYAIIRIHTIVFGPGTEATDGLLQAWLFPAALVTLAVGAFGVLGAKRLMPLIAFSVIGSMGTMMLSVAIFTPEGTTAALYYIVHSTFAAAALFLVADLVVARRGGDGLTQMPPIVQNGLFAALFFGGAVAMAGMPPLSGFLGKLLLMDTLRDPALIGWAWTGILAGSLLTILGFARAGSTVFWKATAVETPPAPLAAEGTADVGAGTAGFNLWGATLVTLVLLGALALLAGPVAGYMEAATAQLYDPTGYIDAVLAPVEGR
jgi:multicomponent K+:H+ antiporter subunit D